jgi:hypothetical protein
MSNLARSHGEYKIWLEVKDLIKYSVCSNRSILHISDSFYYPDFVDILHWYYSKNFAGEILISKILTSIGSHIFSPQKR